MNDPNINPAYIYLFFSFIGLLFILLPYGFFPGNYSSRIHANGPGDYIPGFGMKLIGWVLLFFGLAMTLIAKSSGQ